MPTPDRLTSQEVDFGNGYFPSAQSLSPEALQRTIRAGGNVWLRPQGKIEVANGLDEVSSTNVGARIFSADIQRAELAGALVGNRLPYAGFLRYENGALLFLSEETSAQLYLNETAVTGVTTSSVAGRLRVAIPNGSGGYNDFDAGFDKPVLLTSDVTVVTSVVGASDIRPMFGAIGVALAPWRSTTNAFGPPSETIYNDVPPSPFTAIFIALPSAVSGQDGWVYCGTRWDDRSGLIKAVRYIYNQPRGTFTATNGSPNLTAGVGTFWTRDLRRGDSIVIDGSGYQVQTVSSDTTAVLTANFTGSTNSGKTMTIEIASGSWFDGELGSIIPREVYRPPRAAGLVNYSGRIMLWGIADKNTNTSSESTGNSILACLDTNPEHVGLLGISTATGSNLVNVLAGDGPLYMMTTTSLEVATLTGDPERPYIVRVVAAPGFQAATNGCLYKDYFYGYSNKPLRTLAKENIDVEFGEPVETDMDDWNGERVIVTVDPQNAAVLYIHDNGSSSQVIPWMTQYELWGAPLNFSARIIDAAVVSGKLYITYLSGGNYRTNEWEGGAGIGGTRYVASQYYDPNFLKSNRLKRLIPACKAGTLRVYAVAPGAAVPDVTDTGAAAASFTLSDTADMREPAIYTNIRGDAFAFRVDFSSNDGTFDKLVVRGLPQGEDR